MNSLPQPVLATDLDGTLIPLAGNQQNRTDLAVLGREIQQRNIVLMFVTGRHPESVQKAIAMYHLPPPDWLICDVGTSLYQRGDDNQLHAVTEFADELQQLISDLPVDELRKRLSGQKMLRLQEEEKQSRFKLSYYTEHELLLDAVDAVDLLLQNMSAPYSVIHSVDPFTGDGLIDLLPSNLSKAFALNWWTQFTGHRHESIVYAGDSGNDLKALTSGFRAIVVDNAESSVAKQALDAHQQAGWQNRLFLASAPATSGVLEGCQHYRLIDETPSP